MEKKGKDEKVEKQNTNQNKNKTFMKLLLDINNRAYKFVLCNQNIKTK